MKPTTDGKIFLAWVAVLTMACLWAVWHFRFPPMQDYPQHLFISYVLATFDDSAFDWARNYRVNLNFGSYSLNYLLIGWFSHVVGIESAGKSFTSLYVILMAAVVVKLSRFVTDNYIAWPLLLVFPLLFNQTYYLGFQNYLLSIPLVFLALLDRRVFISQPVSLHSGTRHALYLAALFFSHPYSVLVYIVFSVALGVFDRVDLNRLKRGIVPSLLLGVVFVVWYVTLTTDSGSAQSYPWAVEWWPFENVLRFYVLPFVGMRITNGVDLASALIWAGVAVLMMFFAWRQKATVVYSKQAGLLLALSLSGFAVLPFWFGYYSYFNLRLAPMSYVLIFWVLAAVQLPRRAGHMLGSAALSLVALSISVHGKLDEETREIVPVLEKMERNSRVLPLVVDASAQALDAEYFYQFHAHVPYYYHILVGGGVSPWMFPSPMLPIRYNDAARLPVPRAGNANDWAAVIPAYRYILVRGNLALSPVLLHYAVVVARSGKWTLLENRRRDEGIQ